MVSVPYLEPLHHTKRDCLRGHAGIQINENKAIAAGHNASVSGKL